LVLPARRDFSAQKAPQAPRAASGGALRAGVVLHKK